MTRPGRGGATLAIVTLALVAACRRNGELAAERAPAADSLVLERTLCYGSCPAYRLSIRGDGVIAFASRNPGDSTGTRTDSISPGQVAGLVQEARRLGFFTLPPVIADDSTLCPLRATDHPTATLTIFGADSTQQVVDYHGCYSDHDRAVASRVRQLRQLEMRMDSVAGSSRWARPAER